MRYPPGYCAFVTQIEHADAPPLAGVWTDAVLRREREALGCLTAAAGDRSLCAHSRDGLPWPAAKYHEGAVAALAEARRALGQASGDPDAAVRAIRDSWAARRGSELASAASWSAYLDGGVDALDGLVAETLPGVPRASGARTVATVPVLAQLAAPLRRPNPLAAVVTSLRPPRRLAALTVLVPTVAVWMVGIGGGWGNAPLGWLAVVLVAAVVGAAVLATYLSVRGLRLNVGCTPCAVVSFLSLVCASGMLVRSPHALYPALAALGFVSLGLTQRVRGAGESCAT